jgi:exodeoxyribonuclease-3
MTQPLRIATWNINSLRLRLPLLTRLVAGLDADIICLQETKVPDELFPHATLPDLGYPHFVRAGMKGYNGVAILSRLPLAHVTTAPDWCGKGDCRHVAADVATPSGPITIHNFYVPAGGDVADREANVKFAHKLDFVAEATAWFGAHPPARSVLVGDLNIAPLEHDVWSHRQLLDVVSHTPVETAGLLAWQAEGFVDAVRKFVPESEKLYTWWSYRNKDWRASNRGRRLDHIWTTPDLDPTGYSILTEARDWPQNSDHVPVCVTLAV